jgi:hypothetical protein
MQSILLAVMVVLTPSILLLAWLLRRGPPSDDGDQREIA